MVKPSASLLPLLKRNRLNTASRWNVTLDSQNWKLNYCDGAFTSHTSQLHFRLFRRLLKYLKWIKENIMKVHRNNCLNRVLHLVGEGKSTQSSIFSGKFHGQRSLEGWNPGGSQIIQHNWAIEHTLHLGIPSMDSILYTYSHVSPLLPYPGTDIPQRYCRFGPRSLW